MGTTMAISCRVDCSAESGSGMIFWWSIWKRVPQGIIVIGIRERGVPSDRSIVLRRNTSIRSTDRRIRRKDAILESISMQSQQRGSGLPVLSAGDRRKFISHPPEPCLPIWNGLQIGRQSLTTVSARVDILLNQRAEMHSGMGNPSVWMSCM